MNRKSVGILLVVLVVSLTLVGCLFSIPGMKTGTLRIQGTVVDGENAGISNVAVFVDSEFIGLTGPDGTWSYGNVKKGAKVTVQKADWVFSSEPISITKDEQVLWIVGTKQESNIYSVSGKVVDDQGRGIPSVVVTFTGDSTVTALTDAQGNFTRSNLAGAYAITAAKDGYIIDGSFNVTSPDSNIVFLAKETAPTVYTVSGKVVDGQGRGIPSVVVAFTGDSTVTTLTDAQGNFTRSNLTGAYEITAAKDGYIIDGSFDVASPDSSIVFLAKETTPTIYAVSGKVVDELGQGVPSVTIAFTGDTSGSVVTDAEGNFSRSGLSGTVTLTAAKAGYTFTDPIEVRGADDNITFIATISAAEYSVGGRVVSAGGLAIGGVVVSFEDENGTIQTTFSDSNGFFSKSGLVGRVIVTAFLEGWGFTPVDRTVDGEESNMSFYGTPSMETSYTASGAILNSSEVPVPAVLVKFELLDFVDGEVLWTLAVEGVWQMNGLRGRVRITPEKEGYTFYPASQIIDRANETIGFLAL